MQHLREVAELGQLPGPAQAGALRGEALQVHRVRAVLHHQREHAQVGAGGLRPQPGARRGLTRKQSGLPAVLPKGKRRSAPVWRSQRWFCLPASTVSTVSEVSAPGSQRYLGLVCG